METKILFVSILSIIAIYILLQIYKYLLEVENCKCFKKDNEDYGVNLQYMKFFQVLHIILFCIYIGWSIMDKPIIGSKNGMNFITVQILVLLLIVYFYMFYNVINFYKNVKKECRCSYNNYFKYFVYFEGIVSFMTMLQIVYTFILVLIIITLQFMK
jgi:hypothetical protein